MIRPVRPPGSRRAHDDLLPIRVGARAMKTAIFSTKEYDRQFFDAANKGHRHELTYHTESLHRTTAGMAGGCHGAGSAVRARVTPSRAMRKGLIDLHLRNQNQKQSSESAA